MRTAFVSNYINHHQIPFCNAMYRLMEGDFTFVQTERMEEHRVKMGWNSAERPEYVRCFYEEPEACRRLIADCDIVIFGGTDDESYIKDRLAAGRPVIRMSERLYKTGQWKAVSPRGLKKKYEDHTRYRRAQVYLLCAGAYVPSDFHIIRAYPDKMFRWGYFPETRHYVIEELLAAKGYGEGHNAENSEGNSIEHRAEKVPYLLWAARMIDWKHPELAMETARRLNEKNLDFHMDIIGDGELKKDMEELQQRYGLTEKVSLLGYQAPEDVRRYMEKADIFLFTSDRQEGWGAVANEAMNSGCALIADHMTGAAPYLIKNGHNGFLYRDGRKEQLFARAAQLVQDRQLCRRLGRNAYGTITGLWNAENATEQLYKLMQAILRGEKISLPAEGPCSGAPLLRESASGRLAEGDGI